MFCGHNVCSAATEAPRRSEEVSMRLASFALASSMLASLAALSACAPYASTYGYAYQTGPVVEDYGYAEPAYAQPYYAQPYATPYYAPPPVAGAVIIGGEGYGHRREGWLDNRRYERRYDGRYDGRYDQRENIGREGFRGERFGNRGPEQRQPEQRQRPVFANQPAPMQPPRAAASPIPPPPSGGAAFQDWSNRNVNNSPGLSDNGAR